MIVYCIPMKEIDYRVQFKKLRLALGLSQHKLAAAMGSKYNRDIINSYERGTARVTAEAWEKINMYYLQFKEREEYGVDAENRPAV